MSIKLEQQGVMKGVLKGLEMFEVKGGEYTYVIIGLSFGDTILGGRQGSLKPQPLIKLRRGPRLGYSGSPR